MTATLRIGRVRAYLEFVAAILYFFVAQSAARHFALRFLSDAYSPVVEQATLALLLILGYPAFGALFDRQVHSIAAQGLPLRPGSLGEAGMGFAVGWAAVIACVLPLTLVGGISVVLSTNRASWGWLLADALFFALAALAEEVTFRGYGFQRFELVSALWRGIWLCIVLCDRAGIPTRLEQCQHCPLHRLQLASLHGLLANPGSLG